VIARCEVTENAWERMCGLLPKADLAEDQGMWFSPCTSIHTFFMRFPIDVAFLDRKGKVVALYEAMPAWRHTWIHFWANSVLEMRAGTISSRGIKKGDVLCLSS
jgi:uncharacterized membrane protein (UPF0127 family)